VDVVENLDARRIHAAHHVNTPGNVIEHVVRVIHLAVEVLHADRDVLLFRMGFDLVEKFDAVIGAFVIGLAFAGSGKRDDVRDAVSRGLVDRAEHHCLQPVVIFLFIQAIPDTCAVARLIHGRGEAVLLQDLPLLRSVDKIVTLNSEARGFPALFLQGTAAAEYTACHALLDAAFARRRLDVGWRQRFRRTASSPATAPAAARATESGRRSGGRRLRLSQQNRGSGYGRQEISATHSLCFSFSEPLIVYRRSNGGTRNSLLKVGGGSSGG